MTLLARVGGIPWPRIGATHYHAPLGLAVKGSAIKMLVVYYIVWLRSTKVMGLRTTATSTVLVHCCGQDGYRAYVPQHSIGT